MSADPAEGVPLSVVIPTRNRVGFLRECLASVPSGPQAPQLVVVDDASDDGTGEWLRTLGDPRVHAVSLVSRVGRAEARNHGLAQVQTPFVLFLDDDDRLLPAGVGELVNLLARHPTAVAAVGRGLDFDESGERQEKLGPSRGHVGTVFPEVLAGWCPAQGQAVFRTEAVRAAGGWSTNLQLCDDYDLWLRIAGLGPVVLHPVVTVEVRNHEGQTPWRTPEKMLCAGKELSRAAARRSGAPLTAARVHAAAWNRYRAPLLEERGHRIAAAASYLIAMLLAPELRRSVVMGPELRGDLRRVLGDVAERLPARGLLGGLSGFGRR